MNASTPTGRATVSAAHLRTGTGPSASRDVAAGRGGRPAGFDPATPGGPAMSGDPATPGDPASLIDVRGLSKRYDAFTLGGVDLTVEAGQVVGLVGKNGAGKTTIIKSLLGLVTTDAGTGQVLGCDLARMGDAPGAAAKQRIGVVFDTLALPGHLTVRAAGRLMATVYERWDAAGFAALCEHFELAPKRKLKELSRGMGMKLQLAVALSHGADLLVLDEATAGLDPMARDEVLDLLGAFVGAEDGDGRPTHAVLMSSHITSDLDKIADTIVCVDEGRVAFCVDKDEVCDLMGVARLAEADLAGVLASGAAGVGETRVLRRPHELDLLVPDRYAFARRFPALACDRLDVDGYMALMLRGERVAVPAAAAGGTGAGTGGRRVVIGRADAPAGAGSRVPDDVPTPDATTTAADDVPAADGGDGPRAARGGAERGGER